MFIELITKFWSERTYFPAIVHCQLLNSEIKNPDRETLKFKNVYRGDQGNPDPDG